MSLRCVKVYAKSNKSNYKRGKGRGRNESNRLFPGWPHSNSVIRGQNRGQLGGGVILPGGSNRDNGGGGDNSDEFPNLDELRMSMGG